MNATIRPISDMMFGYTLLGFTKAAAVKYIVGDRSVKRARGNGNRAARRQAMLEMPVQPPLTPSEVDALEMTFQQAVAWGRIDDMNRIAARNQAQRHADVMADQPK